MHLLMHPCILHVEHACQDIVTTEIEEAEAGGEEQQLYEEPVPVEVQDLETNPEQQQGKPRFILKPSVTTLSLSLAIITIFMH